MARLKELMTAGWFITFEGGEGSGKSTQAKRLAERLMAQSRAVTLTREPGGSPFAERLRTLILDPGLEKHAPLAEALLFASARADHLEQVIRPALGEGRMVICDRFSDSTRIYQGFAGRVEPRLLEALELIVVQNTKPDLTIVVDIPAEIGLARAALRLSSPTAVTPPSEKLPKQPRGLLADRFEARDLGFHKRLREGFLEIARLEPQRCVVVDGQKSADEVASEVWAAVTTRLFTEAS
jgi:dTMP kinase